MRELLGMLQGYHTPAGKESPNFTDVPNSLGYNFCISVDGRKVMIEVKGHTGNQNFFELGSTELDAAQQALEVGEIYQIWVIRNMEGDLDIDRLPNPMVMENRKYFRFEVGRVYYQIEENSEL